ncbi:hypothetical protein PTE30175_01551 [Pandoraea terrae]|uniref:Lipoprotein n=1 Tax=Pandoraea terrae TaxID=1537710 RepID=A0A5E4TT02_9BURK|nr:hypothetical protein [Pandoraea terrae]VVD91000.1 hypothetical protein PTE30175_01551 [Pandoraea terrae]
MKTVIRASARAAFVCLAAATLGACANYGTKMNTSTDSLRSGALDAALAAHEAQYEGVKPADRDLLYYFEHGELMRAKPGKLSESTEAWLEADTRVRAWEDDARGKLRKSAGDLGAVLLNETLSRYDGQDYEKVMLSTRLAENHLVAGKWDNARIEVRKMYERETLIAELRDKEVEALKAGAKDKGVAAAGMETIKGYPVEIFSDPQVTNLRNSYQSAASHYLAGFVFEALGEPSLAAAGYRQSIELRPDVPMLKGGLERVATRKRVPSGMTEVLFIVETGWMPARESLKVTLPVPIGTGIKLLTASYPVIRPAKDAFAPTSIDAGGTAVPTFVVTNLDAMARRALKDDMPGQIARSMVRMAVSGVAQEVIERQGGTFGSLMSLAVGLTSAATETADTRQWRTLPAYISLGRATLPSGKRTVTVNTPTGPNRAEVDLNGPYAVVVIRPMGAVTETLVSQPTDDMIRYASQPQKPEPAQPGKKGRAPVKKPAAKQVAAQ